MKRLSLAVLAAAALLLAPSARAQTSSGKWGSIELGAGPFLPNVDREFEADTPYRDMFGKAPGPMWRLHVGKALWSGFGTVEAGLRTGFWRKSGHAVAACPTANPNCTQTSTGDQTTFNIVPTSLTVTYRADQIYEDYRIPVVPYARAALERYNWWVSKGDKWTRRGATNGWSATLGVILYLDFIDPDAARDIDNDVGVNHTGLFFDVTKSKVDDFGSNRSWDLSEKRFQWAGGLLVVF